ncbi:hypothetical protein [Halorubrum amylolyticum]|uniref:hypothetical protein n=1 Tax=Halorubrum amylolyticum TaxID=2508724 RepID=UPI00240D3818|nr:hypothetical protein [Halorubrum amylolyticum]
MSLVGDRRPERAEHRPVDRDRLTVEPEFVEPPAGGIEPIPEPVAREDDRVARLLDGDPLARGRARSVGRAAASLADAVDSYGTDGTCVGSTPSSILAGFSM